jgi:sugar/nucleoside kinase (ribokinase family)
MVDVVVLVSAPFAHASDTPSMITTAPGGSAANQAVWLARAGLAVTIAASIGDDPVGDAALRTLAAEGVQVEKVRRVRRATGVVVALVEPDGQRSMLTDRGANLELTPEMVDGALSAMARVTHVHVSGYCLLDESTRPAGLRAVEWARAAGTSLSVDASSAAPLRSLEAGAFLSWVAGADYLLANLDEGAALTSLGRAEDIVERLAEDVGEAVLTLGAGGALVKRSDSRLVRATANAPVVTDTTGAGDAFCATYLARRLCRRGIDEALADAALAASSAVASVGARTWR